MLVDAICKSYIRSTILSTPFMHQFFLALQLNFQIISTEEPAAIKYNYIFTPKCCASTTNDNSPAFSVSIV